MKKILFLSLVVTVCIFAQQDQEYTYTYHEFPLSEELRARKNGLRIGHISYMKMAPEQAYIDVIEIDEDHRKKGVGKELMKLALEKIKKSHYKNVSLIASPLDTDTDFHQLVKFYEKFDFVVTEDLTVDSAYMEKKL